MAVNKDACLLSLPGPRLLAEGGFDMGPSRWHLLLFHQSLRLRPWTFQISKSEFTKLYRVPTQYLFC